MKKRIFDNKNVEFAYLMNNVFYNEEGKPVASLNEKSEVWMYNGSFLGLLKNFVLYRTSKIKMKIEKMGRINVLPFSKTNKNKMERIERI